MFSVIVLGGIALTAACGGNVVVDGTHSGGVGGTGGHGGISTSTGFPQEGPGTTTGGFGGFGGFGGGSGGTPIVDAGVDGFPQETDQAPDAGTSTTSGGFPQEAP
jgi:hypothetical protein